MRKKERERDAAFALEVLRDCEYATLATTNPDGTPYCVPISQAVLEGAIYFHCATAGHKLDNIAHQATVCISGVRHTRLLPEDYTTEYESAVATGRCEIVTDEDEKIAALRAISEKYAQSHIGDFEARLAKWLHVTVVCKINVERITGKANMPS